MAHVISWYLDKRILLVEYNGTLTSDELQSVIPETFRMMDEGNPPLYMVIDVKAVDKFPMNLGELKRFTVAKHPSLSWISMVGMNPLGRFVITALSQFADLKIRPANTVDEAVAYFSEIDASVKESLKDRLNSTPQAQS
jgi:hypothetical protein